MAPTSKSLLLLLPFLSLLLTPTAAHNITRFLSRFPEFSSFNSLLSQTNVNLEINSRFPITVLAIENSAILSLTSLSKDNLQTVLSLHCMLDYFDYPKILNVGKNSILATLYQASSKAQKMKGFLNVTRLRGGSKVYFGSATPGAPLAVALVKNVGARPFNMSVLQVSGAIIPPGMPGAPTAPVTVLVGEQSESDLASGPAAEAPLEDSATADEATAPAPAWNNDSSVDGPVADAPADIVEGPTESGPTLAPAADADSPGPMPMADDEVSVGDDSSDDSSFAGRVVAGACSLVGVVVGALLFF